MIVDPNSFIARWYFFGMTKGDRRVRLEQGTNLCQMVNRIFWLYFVIAPTILFVLGIAGLGLVKNWRHALVATAILSAFVAIVFAIIYICKGASAALNTSSGQVLRAWVKAKKQRICPLVTFTPPTTAMSAQERREMRDV